MKWLRAGFELVAGKICTKVFPWQVAELRATGDDVIDIDYLKKWTRARSKKPNGREDSENMLENDNWTHPQVGWLFEVLKEWSNDQRMMYLQFVMGRAKLPVDMSTLGYKHKVKVIGHLGK